jgi:beta-1,4-mannosyl-glycoprotein beta-1,4-N-acetylglucosaminyltransferase
MRIIDAFIFFNEIELLKIRLELLYPHVDEFVICEANTTFSGQRKPYTFLEREQEFSPWRDKITFLAYQPELTGLDFTRPTTFDGSSAPWQIERGQRNHLASCLACAKDEDILILSDVDEIWTPELASWLKAYPMQMKAGRLGMQFHYFFMNCRGIGPANSLWTYSLFAQVGLLRAQPHTLHDLRVDAQLPVTSDAGWHFCTLAGQRRSYGKLSPSRIRSSIHRKSKTLSEFPTVCAWAWTPSTAPTTLGPSSMWTATRRPWRL